MNIATMSALIKAQISISDWVQIASIIVLGSIAFLAPYVIERWKIKYRSPRLKIKFKFSPPGCHQTLWNEGGTKTPVYYFRFLVKNFGRSQANICEAVLEKIFKENGAGEMIQDKKFTPVNLKWSGLRNPIERTIQPDREMYCDLGRIHHPNHNYQSLYKNFLTKDQALNKFVFELPERYYSGLDCLIPGKYKLIVSIYSNNAKKTTRQFNLSWTGKWQDEESDMFNELVIR